MLPQKSPGRPRRLTKTQRQELYNDIVKGPEEFGYQTGVWTSALVQNHIHKRFGVFYSQFYIPQLLRNIGCSFIKPKRHYALEDDEVREHVLWIRKKFTQIIKKARKCGGVVLFEDETGQELQTGSVRSWSGKGKPPNKPNHPQKENVKILGVIELFTGTLTYRIHDDKKQKLTNHVMADFFRYVLRKYPKQDVFLILDNAPYHYGEDIRKLQQHNSLLHLEYLPSKAPHLNPIEQLWRELKKVRLHIRYLLDKDMLKRAIRSGMKIFQMDHQRVRSLMNVWEKISADYRGAKKGKYDFLMPKGYEHLYRHVSTVKLERLVNSQ